MGKKITSLYPSKFSAGAQETAEGMSRVGRIGQVLKVTRVASSRCLAVGKTSLPLETFPPPSILLVVQLEPALDISSPGMSLVMW